MINRVYCVCGQCGGAGPEDAPEEPEEIDYLVWFELGINISAVSEAAALKEAQEELRKRLASGLTVEAFNANVEEA